MGDENYRGKPQPTTSGDPLAGKTPQEALNSGARHKTCAPLHLQQAMERAKKGEHMNVPGADNA